MVVGILIFSSKGGDNSSGTSGSGDGGSSGDSEPLPDNILSLDDELNDLKDSIAVVEDGIDFESDLE